MPPGQMHFHDSVTALRFDNWFTRELPADRDATNVPRQVVGACYSRVSPKSFAAPRLVAHSREVATDLGDHSSGELD